MYVLNRAQGMMPVATATATPASCTATACATCSLTPHQVGCFRCLARLAQTTQPIIQVLHNIARSTNAKCRKCTRALEAANVAQLVHEAQFGRRSIHLQLAKGPSWRGTAPECSLLVCIAHLAVQACFRLQRHSRVASGPGLCLWAPALRQHLRFDKLSSEVAVSL